MASPFISARIPPELYKRVENYVEKTQESKTDLITKALTTYLDSYAAQKQQEAGEINSIKTKVSELERRLEEVELFQKMQLPINNLPENTEIQQSEPVISVDYTNRTALAVEPIIPCRHTTKTVDYGRLTKYDPSQIAATAFVLKPIEARDGTDLRLQAFKPQAQAYRPDQNPEQPIADKKTKVT